MSPTVFVIVLFAAALHATWNAVVKIGADKLLTTTLVTATAALLAVFALPFLAAPARPSWGFIGASALLQIAYFVLVARTYRVADMSQTYPLMRGAAPLLVAVASAAFLRERLTLTASLGVGVICAGVLTMAAARQEGNSKRGVALALSNAVVIAGYTLIDGVGVRRSGAAASYTLWIFLITGLVLVGWALLTRPRTSIRYFAANWRRGIVGGFGTVLSYGLALWAMTAAPVAVIAALRETSILFGAGLSGLVLKERMGWVRILAVGIIAAGAVGLRLA